MENINFYFDVYRIDESGEYLEIQNSLYFESQFIEKAKKHILVFLKKLQDWQNNDFLFMTFRKSDSEIVYEGKVYKDGEWVDLIDVNFLDANKLSQIYQSEEFTFDNSLETVETWEDIVTNFLEFEKLDIVNPSDLLKTYSQFYHWYYWPETELFAPSKFLGYKNRTVESYNSSGTGGVTQIALSKFFKKISKDSDEFKVLYNKLKQVSKNNYGKDLSSQILEGKGGIYVPIK